MNDIANITRIAVSRLENLSAAIDLLNASGLPTSDIVAHSAPALQFFGCMASGELIGVIGLQRAGDVALLRSLAVMPEYQGNGLGQALVAHAEAEAAAQHLQALYLLTGGASAYFAALGYTAVPRTEVPPPVRDTAQFCILCPSSATVMTKALARP